MMKLRLISNNKKLCSFPMRVTKLKNLGFCKFQLIFYVLIENYFIFIFISYAINIRKTGIKSICLQNFKKVVVLSEGRYFMF